MDSVILIGMPGVGKSTVGVLLAKALGLDFVDTDLVIQRLAGRTLQSIIDSEGLAGFIAAEERIVAGVRAPQSVIATGGSVIFGEGAMQALSAQGRVVYLRARYETVSARISDITTRGVAMSPGQSLREVYDERRPLYERYADITVDVDNGSIEQTVSALVDALK